MAVQTSYSSLVSARRTTAYSLPGAKKIGSGNVTFVATSPVLDVWIFWTMLPLASTLVGLNVTVLPITVLVGNPNSVVLIWTLTGAFPESTLAK